MFSFIFDMFLFCTLAKTMHASEPQCSPFHYQEQMIEKMVKLKILVQKMKADMDATQQRVLEMTQRLDDDVTLLKSEWDAERTVLRNDSAALKRELEEQIEANTEVMEQKMKADIDSGQQRVLEMTQHLDDDVTLFKSELDADRTLLRNDSVLLKRQLEEQIKANVQVMEEIRGAVKIPSIHFLAKDLNNISPSSGEVLVYATTLQNEGQGYDKTTGKFTAPVTGTYLFTAQFCLKGGRGHYIYYAFVSEVSYVEQGFFREFDTWCCYTADFITVLKTGAQVWTTCPSLTTEPFTQSDYSSNTFSGVLMHL